MNLGHGFYRITGFLSRGEKRKKKKKKKKKSGNRNRKSVFVAQAAWCLHNNCPLCWKILSADPLGPDRAPAFPKASEC